MTGIVQGYTTNYSFAKVNFDAIGWHDYVNENFDDLDAIIQAISGFTGLTVWDNSTAYVVGNRIVDPASLFIYQCAVNHTSAAASSTFAQDFAAHPTYWTLVTQTWSSIGFTSLLTLTDIAVSATLTANVSYRITAAGTYTLPVLNSGEAIVIARDLTSGSIIIGRNGQTIDGLSSNFTLDVNRDIYIFIRTASNTIVTRRIGWLPNAATSASSAYPSVPVVDATPKTSNFTIMPNTSYTVDISAGNVTATPDSSFTDGNSFEITLINTGGYTLTIAQGGFKMRGLAEDATIDLENAVIRARMKNTTYGFQFGVST